MADASARTGKADVVVGTVVSLRRYPVKSMTGEELSAVDVTERGLLGDRAYALVDTATGLVASAKNPRKWAGLFQCGAAYAEPPQPGRELPPVRVTLPDGEVVSSDDRGANATLSKFIGRDVTLTRTAPPKLIYEHYWFDFQTALGRPVEGAEGDRLTTLPLGFGAPGTFFDYTPVHLLTTATLARLQELYPSGRWDARRFRPNIVVAAASGDSGFVEDAWIRGSLSVGEVRLKVIDTMVRCVMTTLPQGDLPGDPGILRALADHHRVLMPAVGKELPAVGVAATVAAGGQIRCDDPVRLAG